MSTLAAKTLRKMLADPDPSAWLVAADVVEERGGDAAKLREFAALVRRVVETLRWIDGQPDRIVFRRPHSGGGRPIAGDAMLRVKGGAIAFTCWGELPLKRCTTMHRVRRAMLKEDTYAWRRAAGIAAEIVEALNWDDPRDVLAQMGAE